MSWSRYSSTFCIGPRTRSRTFALTATFKAFILDEAWIFVCNRTIHDYITRAEKTWRKKNAAMILATQSVHELVESDMLAVVNECCATKIFLANPSIDHKVYAEIFHLNDTELELLSSGNSVRSAWSFARRLVVLGRHKSPSSAS